MPAGPGFPSTDGTRHKRQSTTASGAPTGSTLDSPRQKRAPASTSSSAGPEHSGVTVYLAGATGCVVSFSLLCELGDAILMRMVCGYRGNAGTCSGDGLSDDAMV